MPEPRWTRKTTYSESLLAAIEDYCQKHGVGFSEGVRRLVSIGLKRRPPDVRLGRPPKPRE